MSVLESHGHLSDDDMMALQQLPDYVSTVKKRLSESGDGHRYIMNAVSKSALDRLSCLADVGFTEL